MRVVENSAACLRLQETSGILPAILLGGAAFAATAVICAGADPRQLISAGLFLAAAVFFRRISRVELDKAARAARIFRVDMWRRSERTIGFDDISDVQVEIMRPDTSAQCHTRLTLVTRAGAVPLTAGFRPDLDAHIALRESMVEVIFAARARPAPLDAAQLLIDAGRPLAAAMRAA